IVTPVTGNSITARFRFVIGWGRYETESYRITVVSNSLGDTHDPTSSGWTSAPLGGARLARRQPARGRARQHRAQRGDPDDRRPHPWFGGDPGPVGVGHQCVHTCLRRPALHRRRPGRSARPATDAPDRTGPFRTGLARLGVRPLASAAHLGARIDGN